MRASGWLLESWLPESDIARNRIWHALPESLQSRKARHGGAGRAWKERGFEGATC